MASIAIDLSSAMTTYLEVIIASRSLGNSVIQLARCILLARTKRKFGDIHRLVGLSTKTVRKWVHRFADSVEALKATE